MGEEDDQGKKYIPTPGGNSPPPVPKKRKGLFSRSEKKKTSIGGKLKLAAYLIIAGGIFAGGIFASEQVKNAYVQANNAIYNALHTNPSEARASYQNSLRDYDNSLNEFGSAIIGVVQDSVKYATPAQLEQMTSTTYQSMSQQQQTQFVSTAAQDIGMVCTTK